MLGDHDVVYIAMTVCFDFVASDSGKVTCYLSLSDILLKHSQVGMIRSIHQHHPERKSSYVVINDISW